MALKPKQKQFADKLLANPKMNATDAYLATHKTENRRTANDLASKTLRKPEVQIYMQKHADLAKERMVELMMNGKDDISLRASQDILDRTYGKAISKQQIESTNLNLNVDVDLTLSKDFTAFLKQKTMTNTSLT